jgi:hypothetical protein
MDQQIKKLNRDIECHWQELSALNTLKSNKIDEVLEVEITKIKNLIKAKQDLVTTLVRDFTQRS